MTGVSLPPFMDGVAASPTVVVLRFEVDDQAAFMSAAREAIDVLGGRPGLVELALGRAIDDPRIFILTTRWADVGSYRRALSSGEVKLRAVPFLSTAIDEPTAFEVLGAVAGRGVESFPGALAEDAARVNLGEAAAPRVSSGVDAG